MIKAIIFDMDGVLLDSMPMHLNVWKSIFEKRGLEFSLKIFEKYNGTSSKDISKKLVKTFNLDEDPDDIFNEKINMELVVRDKIVDLFPETIEVLKKLRNKNFKIAIATGAMEHTVNYVNERFELNKYIDVFVQSKDVQNSKPAPDIFLLAAKELGIEPENCVVVKDAVNGIIAAKNGKMTSIAITNTSPKESFVGIADYIIDNLNELDKILGEKLCVE